MNKKIFAGSIFLIFTFFSCQKGLDYSLTDPGGTSGDSTVNGSQYYMSFKANGVQKNYTDQTSALFSTVNSLSTGSLFGGLSANFGNEGMSITLYSDSAFTTGIIYNDGGIPVLGIPQATLTYTDSSGTQYTSITPLNPDVIVIFTEITSTYVKGTFTGNLESLSGTDSLSVTSGTFVLPRS